MDMNNTETMDTMAKMYFHASSQATILFRQWTVYTWQEMLGSCVGVFLMALLFETFKYGRYVMMQKKLTPTRYDINHLHSDNSKHYGTMETTSYDIGNTDVTADATVLQIENDEPHETSQSRLAASMSNGWVWLDSLLYMIEIFISYCLMLVIMLYNAYLCISVVLGAGLGYLLLHHTQTRYATLTNHCL